MILGTVTDKSPGAKGTAAVSDESMSEWMAHLYMQKPKPTNVNGVQVTISAINPLGETEPIGTATTDTNGNYGIMWTPQLEGQYKIIAKFEATNSYGSSEASTYLGVSPALSQPTSAPTTNAPTSTPSATQTPVPTAISPSPTVAPTPGTGISTEILLIAGAAIVIIIAVIAAALVLRKRK